MRIDPVPPTYRLIDRRKRSDERRAAPELREAAARDRRRPAPLTTGILAAPFGAHLLGQIDPTPVSAQRAVCAYKKAAVA